MVEAKYFEENYRDRYTASNIIWQQFGAGAGPVLATAETPHLKLSLISSDTVARPGARLALALQVELKPGMHVYAPGLEGGHIPIPRNPAAPKGRKTHPHDPPR